MLKIALTGLPCSGKTYVLNLMQKLFGKNSIIFNLDKIIESIYENNEIFYSIYENIIDFQYKNLDLTQKKVIIIDNIIKKPSILKKIMAKINPIIRVKIIELFQENTSCDYLIFEIPLLFESRMDDLFDINILIKSTHSQMNSRLKKRKINPKLYKIFLRSHYKYRKKKKYTNHIFFNNINNEI